MLPWACPTLRVEHLERLDGPHTRRPLSTGLPLLQKFKYVVQCARSGQTLRCSSMQHFSRFRRILEERFVPINFRRCRLFVSGARSPMLPVAYFCGRATGFLP